MKLKIASKKTLANFINLLIKKEDRRLIGPKRKDKENVIFAPISSWDELCLANTVTLLPPKQFLFPNGEELIRFEMEGKEVKRVYSSLELEPQIIIGVRPCDIHGILHLDKIMNAENADCYYIKRREATLIIGLDCLEPLDDYCNCASFNTLEVTEGFDLFLTEAKDRYYIRIGSPQGEALLANCDEIIEAKEEELKELYKKRSLLFPRHLKLSVEELPAFLASDKVYNHPYWEELGRQCLSCGSCNIVCPTCYCFDVREEMSLALNTGSKCRYWDGCHLGSFAQVAGGFNFRGKTFERVRHRMYRKGKYQVEKYNQVACVGCGRCARACLVNISPVTTYNNLAQSAYIAQKGDER